MKKNMTRCFVLLIPLLLLQASQPGGTSPHHPLPLFQPAPAQYSLPHSRNSEVTAGAAIGKMPLYFIANEGQMDEQVAYYVQGKDKMLYFTADGLTIVLNGIQSNGGEKPEGAFGDRRRSSGFANNGQPSGETAGKSSPVDSGAAERWVVKLDFVEANPDVRPAGEDKAEALISYFKGRPEDWRTGLATYSKIAYRGLWPGIDLVYSGTVDRLKYEFIVQPGADPSHIRLAYRGATQVGVNGEGKLEVTTPVGALVDDRPAAFQDIDGRQVNIQASYRMDSDEETTAPGGCTSYGFDVGEYDRTRPLVLDPAVLVYCGFIGGNGWENCYGIAVDGQGNAYVTGATTGTETTFPVTVGPDLSWNGTIDAFAAKINASGTALVYCGFIGGDQQDYGYGIAVDDSGCAYITGDTISTQATFPVAVGPILTQNGGEPGSYPDAFVAKVNASGTSLVYCGYVGGKYEDRGYAIAVDGAGHAYITGHTMSDETTFPAVGGPDLIYDGGADIFVAKVNPAGSGFTYRGYIGGLGSEYGYGIDVDASGNAYVTGTAY